TLLIGVFGGVVVGLTSVGSGSLMMVLLLMLYPTLAASELVGTDLVQAIPLVAAAAAGHMLFGKVELPVTLSLLVGAVPGVYLGARVSSRSPDRLIRPVLAVVLIVSGLKMLKVPTPVVGAVAAVLAVVAIGMIVRSARVASVEPAVVEG
ncbi:MAG: TSUP family transporter, partial [Acidimicrobiales bacterium]